jgi:mono/diheme cytochrome c family protein
MRHYPLPPFAALSLLATLLLLVSCSSVPKQTPEERVTMLQAQVHELDRQLMVMHEADGDEQHLLMQIYWRTLQIQLTYVRNLPGVEARGCADWSMMDPLAGAFQYSKPCPSLHDEGPSAGLPFPDQLSPLLFQLMMHQELDTLTAQVDAIAAEPSQTARLDLLRQHYETRYRDLQTVLGRDWMWTLRKESDLPDPDSMGATLFAQYCGQCHNPPPPAINTPAQWGYITQRMSTIIERQAHSGEMGVNFPSADEFQLIAQYLMAHGYRPTPSK